ncbi:MAG: hypothetical protein M1822_000534 [Bathelium mastoideum]|nr:MAG: hypothetical protein M1822_000534 [Bathelium mastoideum]
MEFHTRHIDLQIKTASLQTAEMRHKDVRTLLEARGYSVGSALELRRPFHFLQNSIRNDRFFGRTEILETIQDTLEVRPSASTFARSATSGIVLHGLGGCGKSSVAREYMYQRINDYKVILWLYADTREKLDTQFITLSRLLGGESGSADYCVQWVKHWISHLDCSWLIIYDNADDPNILRAYWPTATHGSIILTSRNPHCGKEVSVKQAVQVKEFDIDEASRFLRWLLDDVDDLSREDEVATSALATHFSGLALAIQQAATFMNRFQCSPSRFAKLYEEKASEIHDFRVPGYDKTLADVWIISLRALSQDAKSLLDILSLLDPDVVPMVLFEDTDLMQDSEGFALDPLRLLNAVDSLVSQSLVERNSHNGSLKLHRFFRDATFRKLSLNAYQLEKTTNIAGKLILRVLPKDDLAVRHPENWASFERYISHVNSLYACIHHLPNIEAIPIILECFVNIIRYHFECGEFTKGEEAFNKANSIAHNSKHQDHSTISKINFYGCRIFQETCSLEKALEAIEKAQKHYSIAIEDEPTLSSSSFWIRLLSNVGVCYTAVGRFAESEEYHKTAIATCQRCGTAERDSLGNLMQNLGSCYLWSGRLDLAEEILRKALLQPNRNKEGNQYTLANTLWKQKKYDEAFELHKEVLQVYYEKCGPLHTCTADSLHKLGSILAEPGFSSQDLEKAEYVTQRQMRAVYADRDIFNRHKLREAKAIRQDPRNMGHPSAQIYTSRTMWRLADVLNQKTNEPCREAEQLRLTALESLRTTHRRSITKDEDGNAVFDKLVFYWSR